MRIRHDYPPEIIVVTNQRLNKRGNMVLRKKKTLIISILAAVMLVPLLTIFLLPTLVSTNWLGNKAKMVINDKIPGTLNFDKLSLSWFKGLNIQGIDYQNPGEGIAFSAADISTKKGLFSIASNYSDIGEIIIKNPVTHIDLRKKSSAKKQPIRKEQQQPGSSAPSPQSTTNKGGAKKSAKTATTVFPPINTKVHITGGSVLAVSADTERILLKGLELQLDIIGEQNTLEYQIAFQTEDGAGQVQGAGSITVVAGEVLAFDKTKSRATLDIKNWQLGDLLTVIASKADIPTGQGLLSGQLSISGNSDRTLVIQGNLRTEDISLSGGPLKSDTPSLDLMTLDIDVKKTESSLDINTLTLKTPLISGNISGSSSSGDNSETKRELTGQATVNIAQIFTQFPDTLNLKKGIKVSDGQIDINTKIVGSQTSTLFDTRLLVKNLRGIAGKKNISLDKPITLALEGEQSQKGLRLENFALNSSFLQGKGKGDSDRMRIQLTADIGAALKEIEKFITLDGWKSNGKMDLTLQVAAKTEEVRSVKGEMIINDFVLKNKSETIVPRNTIKMDLVNDVRLNKKNVPKELLDTTLNFQAWIGNGAVTVQQFIPASDQTAAIMKGFTVQSDLDLTKLTTLLRSFKILPEGTSLAGKTTIESVASIDGNLLAIDTLKIDTSDFHYKNSSQEVRDKSIILSTHGSANLETKIATLNKVTLTTGASQILLPELLINNWTKPANAIKTKGTVAVDLSQLTSQLADFLTSSSDTSVSGKAEVTLDIDLTQPQQQSVQLSGTIKPFKLSSKDGVLSEEAVGFKLGVQGDSQNQTFQLTDIEISTIPVSLKATASLSKDKNEKLLNVEGAMDLDLQALSAHLQSFLGIQIAMSGTPKVPLSLKTTSMGGKWEKIPQHTEFSTSFHAESIKGFGLFIESLDLPVQLHDSIGDMKINGTVNRGTLLLQPNVNFIAQPAIVSIPDDSKILTGVGLTEDMSKDLMAKFHPLFKGAAVTQGTVDMTMDHFTWPLDQNARKDATLGGSFAFHDIKLKAGGLLAPLLIIMKVEEQEITVKDQPMNFVGKDERIHCSPLEVQVNEYSLILSGSIGFDQTLDYIAKIPVTSKMVSGDVYKYLKGTFITVPIKGTAAKPSIGKNVVQAALKDLILQAGKKQLSDQAGKFLQKLFQ